MDNINTKIKATHTPTKSMFEIFCLRFPDISGNIFQSIDDKSLVKCKGISKTIGKFSDEEKFYWIRIIQKYWKNLEEFSESWKTVIHQTPNEIVKELATACQQFFQFRSSRFEKQWSPLHVAAERGLLRLCQLITQRTGEINPRQGDGTTALHMAAQEGHLEICLFIMEKLENKNPEDNNGWTPLHSAAQEGHLEVCRAIMEKLENKNPRKNNGWTPLHFSAQEGHLDVCRAIIEKLENKNPGDNFGFTPKDAAHARGHWIIVQLFESDNAMVGNIN